MNDLLVHAQRKIVAKLMDIAGPGDRVDVIFGAWHKHWRYRSLDYAAGFEVVPQFSVG